MFKLASTWLFGDSITSSNSTGSSSSVAAIGCTNRIRTKGKRKKHSSKNDKKKSTTYRVITTTTTTNVDNDDNNDNNDTFYDAIQEVEDEEGGSRHWTNTNDPKHNTTTTVLKNEPFIFGTSIISNSLLSSVLPIFQFGTYNTGTRTNTINLVGRKSIVKRQRKKRKYSNTFPSTSCTNNNNDNNFAVVNTTYNTNINEPYQQSFYNNDNVPPNQQNCSNNYNDKYDDDDDDNDNDYDDDNDGYYGDGGGNINSGVYELQQSVGGRNDDISVSLPVPIRNYRQYNYPTAAAAASTTYSIITNSSPPNSLYQNVGTYNSNNIQSQRHVVEADNQSHYPKRITTINTTTTTNNKQQGTIRVRRRIVRVIGLKSDLVEHKLQQQRQQQQQEEDDEEEEEEDDDDDDDDELEEEQQQQNNQLPQCPNYSSCGGGHYRFQCKKSLFNSAQATALNQIHCTKCYCYVCNVPVSQCYIWSSSHCHATPYGSWGSLWDNRRLLHLQEEEAGGEVDEDEEDEGENDEDKYEEDDDEEEQQQVKCSNIARTKIATHHDTSQTQSTTNYGKRKRNIRSVQER